MDNNEDVEQSTSCDHDNEQEQSNEAESEAVAECTELGQWPDSVGFRENDPKKGMVYLILRIDPLQTNVPGFRGKATALNGEIIHEEKTYKPREVDFRIRITSGDSEGTIYEYKKSLPKEIDPSASTIKFDKNGQVKLRLSKTKPELSWAHHREYLTLPDPK